VAPSGKGFEGEGKGGCSQPFTLQDFDLWVESNTKLTLVEWLEERYTPDPLPKKFDNLATGTKRLRWEVMPALWTTWPPNNGDEYHVCITKCTAEIDRLRERIAKLEQGS
jgi:hypothetical protein